MNFEVKKSFFLKTKTEIEIYVKTVPIKVLSTFFLISTFGGHFSPLFIYSRFLRTPKVQIFTLKSVFRSADLHPKKITTNFLVALAAYFFGDAKGGMLFRALPGMGRAPRAR